MRWALVILFCAHEALAATPPSFDLGACTLDLAADGSERGKPPPVMTRIPRADAIANARVLKAALGTRRVELDAYGMATAVELHATAPADVLAFVRAHPCLFGVVDPSALSAHAFGTWIAIDVAPVSIGAIQAEIVGDHVRIDGHFWPVEAPAFDHAHLLDRFVGVAARIEAGTAYLIDPKTHRHRGCVPLIRDVVTTVSYFDVHPGPVLACRPDAVEVVPGAFVTGPDPIVRTSVLAELPAALDPAGAKIDPAIVPASRAAGASELAWDYGSCP